MRSRKVVENHSLDDEPSHVAILTLCHPFIGHPVEMIEMFYPHNGMDFRFNLPTDLLVYMLNCFVGCRNGIFCLALPVIDGVRTFIVWNPITNRNIVIQDTFYLDTEKTQSFYAFGHHYLSTDYSIVHVYGMANKIEEMNMRMYSSSSAQWSVEQDAPSFIHYLHHNGMDFRFNLPTDLLVYMLNCFVGCRNGIFCLALPVIDGVRTFIVWNPITNRNIVIQDTFYLDTEKTQSFYAFGHHYLSTDYSIVHVYGMANKIEEMNMRMYSSSSAQWSVEQDAPSFIHYLHGAPVVCNGVVHWINKVIEERPFSRSIVTYSLNVETWNEVLVLEEEKQEIQLLVIHNGVPALLTHPDHLEELM